jgi:carbamoyl-phosphate synthase large subunit
MPDKLTVYRLLSEKHVTVPETVVITTLKDVDRAFSDIGSPLWIRAKSGAGGRLGLKVESPKEAKLWVKLNTLQHRVKMSDFFTSGIYQVET